MSERAHTPEVTAALQVAGPIPVYATDTDYMEVADRVARWAEKHVAEAVAAERERCAKAAEKRGFELLEPAIGSDIANTIREPDAPPQMPA